MRQGDLFRIRYILGAIAVFFSLLSPARALWLEVAGASHLEPAQLLVNLDGRAPPKGDDRHGLFAMPPSYREGAPRMAVEYRAEFPLSVTFVTDGAIGGDTVAPTGALNLTTKVIFTNEWWSPAVTANLGGFSLEGMVDGRVEVGQTAVRSEWKVKF